MAKKRYIKDSKGTTVSVTTDTLGLEKPLLNENYDIEVHNRNMDKIDNAIQEVKGKIDGLELVAERVSIADPTNKFEATNVEDALLENKTSIHSANSNINNLNNKVNTSQLVKLTEDSGASFSRRGGDANDFVDVIGKVYTGDNIANSPLQQEHIWWTIENYSDGDYGHQIATAWYSDERYVRRCRGGQWTSWRSL